MTTIDHRDVQTETFEVHNPGTGELVGLHPIHDETHVRAAVDRARVAADWWQGLGFEGRRKRLDAFRGVIARRINQLAGVINEEMGKPHSDAVLEIALVLDHIAWAGKSAPKVLKSRRVPSGAMAAHLAARVEYRPLGVVGVIGPWNYPVFTPMGSIVYALAAGNTIVFKPSEFTPAVGAWLVNAFGEVVPEHPVFQLITGDGATGAALCRAGVDKLAFTGSTATAKKVMASCAETLTPVVAECGGKDALLVAEDANLEAAADAAVWAGMANAGQSCIGVERVYVHESVYDRFEQIVRDKVEGLRAGSDPAALLGPITMASQVAIINRHVQDALDRGGRVLAGAVDVEGQVVQPLVLVDVPEDSDAVREETFGPTFTLRKVKSMQEAVDLTNATNYGLAGSVFSKRHGREIASGIRSGMVSINSVFSFAMVPSVPFGGVGESGFGRIHGADGLREFCYPRSEVRQRFKAPLALTTLARTPATDERLGKIIALVHGSK